MPHIVLLNFAHIYILVGCKLTLRKYKEWLQFLEFECCNNVKYNQ